RDRIARERRHQDRDFGGDLRGRGARARADHSVGSRLAKRRRAHAPTRTLIATPRSPPQTAPTLGASIDFTREFPAYSAARNWRAMIRMGLQSSSLRRAPIALSILAVTVA